MGRRSDTEESTRVLVTPDDTARYIENMSAELARLAHVSGFDLLAYLLDVAREEAAARSLEGARSAKSKLS
ncbi:hypothetical protein [Amorphus sp. 3PC139-8]|uniref:hypothetical protein n=1 Tax=Amorphus sp. 3PC139-8 TaxID=2735676 RepID=UPI00345D0CA3